MQQQESNTEVNNKMFLVGCDINTLPNSLTGKEVNEIRNLVKNYDLEFKPQIMQLAIDEANTCFEIDGCGPFGACVVFGDIIVGLGHNQVVKNNDPTCHAEMDCIRNACDFLQTYDLTGCVLYSSCEPCPMCLAACKWANIELVYYANKQEDADKIGFRDKKFYEMFKDESYKMYSLNVKYPNAIDTFDRYKELNKTIY